jgi:hypothetical protein
MARFILSPGVVTREVDNSQYTPTQPTGNVAAVVGYAEKGPFEPTLVSGTQEFNQVFGKTLEDAPYLAQTAYKYFTQGLETVETQNSIHKLLNMHQRKFVSEKEMLRHLLDIKHLLVPPLSQLEHLLLELLSVLR